MENITYTTVDRVLAKFSRDLRGTDYNEDDLIEWAGEALELMEVFPVLEQCVSFGEVRDFRLTVPRGLKAVLQVAMNTKWTVRDKKECSITSPRSLKELFDEEVEKGTGDCADCGMEPPEELFDGMYYNPYADIRWDYIDWMSNPHYKNNYIPVRLANHSFFNTLVYKEKDMSVYKSCPHNHEYTIKGTTEKSFVFSFDRGYVAVAHVRTAIDKKTGMFLVPDNQFYLNAITYYLKWKLSERLSFLGREGFTSLARESERLFYKYSDRAKNHMKMPKTVDEYQNLMEQSHNPFPSNKGYYGYFGNISRENTFNRTMPFG